MSTEPDVIREQIRRTQAELSSDVDALAYKASPSRVMHERTDRIRGALRGVRERVMGVASDVGDQAGAATSAMSEATTAVTDTAAATADRVKRAAEGNPLAAGLIVFGCAWLISSLMPSSEREQQAALAVKATVRDHAAPVVDAVGEAAREVGEHLQEPLREAAESVRSTAADAVHAMKDETTSAVEGVRDNTRP